MLYDLNEILLASVKKASTLQDKSGAMPSGRNGPHNHNMTSARNTSHWAIAFAHSYELTGNATFKNSAVSALDYLVSSDLWPMKGAFWKRSEKGKNSFNGLIGQCWCLEALIYCSDILDKPQYFEIAEFVFLKHHFDKTRNLWYQLDIDGSPASIEFTLNQQIWFASIGVMIAKKNKSLCKNIESFLSSLPKNIERKRDGLLPLAIKRDFSLPLKLGFRLYTYFKTGKQKLRQIEIGYHLFALCGLATLYKYMPENKYWSTVEFKNSIEFIKKDYFKREIFKSKFGMQYNVPGFELPYIVSVFQKHGLQKMESFSNDICIRQIRDHFDFSSSLLVKNTVDPETLSSRIYEIYRIPQKYRKIL
jgi:hypothetical protein